MWKEKWWLTLVASVAVVLVISLQETSAGCNEAVCGSVVSKCLLTQSCKCDRKENGCPCCKDCYNCLGFLWTECCSCVEMCNLTSTTTYTRQSYVGKYESPIPSLFDALTESPDELDRWSAIKFPFDMDYSQLTNVKHDMKIAMISEEQNTISVKSKTIVTANCTVAYWAQCMSQSKCEQSCATMGASQVRWFHDGCCECVGEYCINYGIDDSRCSKCPIKEDQLVEEDQMDFGEDEED